MGRKEAIAYYDSAKAAVDAGRYAAFADDPALSGDFSGPPPADTTPPDVTMSSPTDWSRQSGVVTVTGTASDDHRLLAVLLVNGVYSGQMMWAPSGSFSFEWDSRRYRSGLATLQLEVADEAGNIAFSPVVPIGVDSRDLQPPPN